VTAPPARLGLITSRQRLAAACGRPLGDAPELLLAQAAAAEAAGLGFFQVRESELEGGALLALVHRLVAVVGRRCRLVVNDRADVAALAGTGLHLKRASLPAAGLRAWMPPGTWISLAVHDPSDVARATAIDAVLAGTVAPSASKPAGHPTLGATGLRAVVSASQVPVFALGGLRPGDWRWIGATGATGIAAIGAFLPRRGESPADAVARAVSDFIAEID